MKGGLASVQIGSEKSKFMENKGDDFWKKIDRR